MYFGIRDSYMKVFWLNCQKINKLHYLQIITTQPLAAQTFVGIHVCPMNMIITEFEELADIKTRTWNQIRIVALTHFWYLEASNCWYPRLSYEYDHHWIWRTRWQRHVHEIRFESWRQHISDTLKLLKFSIIYICKYVTFFFFLIVD